MATFSFLISSEAIFLTEFMINQHHFIFNRRFFSLNVGFKTIYYCYLIQFFKAHRLLYIDDV